MQSHKIDEALTVRERFKSLDRAHVYWMISSLPAVTSAKNCPAGASGSRTSTCVERYALAGGVLIRSSDCRFALIPNFHSVAAAPSISAEANRAKHWHA
jgi:hypothetical protein